MFLVFKWSDFRSPLQLVNNHKKYKISENVTICLPIFEVEKCQLNNKVMVGGGQVGRCEFNHNYKKSENSLNSGQILIFCAIWTK